MDSEKHHRECQRLCVLAPTLPVTSSTRRATNEFLMEKFQRRWLIFQWGIIERWWCQLAWDLNALFSSLDCLQLIPAHTRYIAATREVESWNKQKEYFLFFMKDFPFQIPFFNFSCSSGEKLFMTNNSRWVCWHFSYINLMTSSSEMRQILSSFLSLLAAIELSSERFMDDGLFECIRAQAAHNKRRRCRGIKFFLHLLLLVYSLSPRR